MLGTMIRTARVAAGLSQKVLAERVGISPPHICQAEAGKRKLSPSYAKSLAEAFGEDPNPWILEAVRDMLPAELHGALTPALAPGLSPFDMVRDDQRLRLPHQADSLSAVYTIQPDGSLVITRTYRNLRPIPGGLPVSEILIRDRMPNALESYSHPTAPFSILAYGDSPPPTIAPFVEGTTFVNRIAFQEPWSVPAGFDVTGLSIVLSSRTVNAYFPSGTRGPEQLARTRAQQLDADSGCARGYIPAHIGHFRLEVIQATEPPRSWRAFAGPGVQPTDRAQEFADMSGHRFCRSFSFTEHGDRAVLEVVEPIALNSFCIAWKE